MSILQISRDKKNNADKSLIPKLELRIPIDEYLLAVEDDTWENKVKTYHAEGLEVKYVLSDYFSNGLKLFSLTFDEGQATISYDGKLKDEIIVKCFDVAEKLQAFLLAEVGLEYPRSKVIAAHERIAKKSQEPKIEYQKESFGGNNIWLAIRSNLASVRNYYNFRGDEKEWNDALEKMHSFEGMFLYEFRDWVFIAGQKTDILFDCQVKGEKAIEKCHVTKLLEWGEYFSEIQLFMHYSRSIHFNAFYRVLNGELVYGEYETESYQKKYGKTPNNLTELPDKNANSIASEWSISPNDLRYKKELENTKAWIVNIRPHP